MQLLFKSPEIGKESPEQTAYRQIGSSRVSTIARGSYRCNTNPLIVGAMQRIQAQNYQNMEQSARQQSQQEQAPTQATAAQEVASVAIAQSAEEERLTELAEIRARIDQSRQPVDPSRN